MLLVTLVTYGEHPAVSDGLKLIGIGGKGVETGEGSKSMRRNLIILILPNYFVHTRSIVVLTGSLNADSNNTYSKYAT